MNLAIKKRRLAGVGRGYLFGRLMADEACQDMYIYHNLTSASTLASCIHPYLNYNLP